MALSKSRHRAEWWGPGGYKKSSPVFNWMSLDQYFLRICTKYSPCAITRPVILLGHRFSLEHKMWTFGKVGGGNGKLFSPCLTTARRSHLLPPANLEPVISGIGLIYKTPRNVPTKLILSAAVVEILPWPCALAPCSSHIAQPPASWRSADAYPPV